MERRKQEEEKKRKFPPYAICISYLSRSSHQRCSIRKGILKSRRKSSQENTCARVSFLIKLQVQADNFIKKETLEQMFSCEICGNFKNALYRTHLQDCSCLSPRSSSSG